MHVTNKKKKSNLILTCDRYFYSFNPFFKNLHFDIGPKT